jgi:hypothetical protein
MLLEFLPVIVFYYLIQYQLHSAAYSINLSLRSLPFLGSLPYNRTKLTFVMNSF